MDKASEALAEVRGWLCDNLSEGDAGRACGMLSVVSRHITELEDENARLRSCLSDDAENARQIMGENAKLREQIHWLKKGDVLHVLTDQELADQQRHEREVQASITALESENTKLSELCKDIWNDALLFEGFWDYVHDDRTIYREDELPHYQERMRECGIEVK